jgi:hypothetical protein
MFNSKQATDMQSGPDIKALKIALAGLEARLADPEPGMACFGGAFEHEDRLAAIRLRIAEIKRLIGDRRAPGPKVENRPADASAPISSRRSHVTAGV